MQLKFKSAVIFIFLILLSALTGSYLLVKSEEKKIDHKSSSSGILKQTDFVSGVHQFENMSWGPEGEYFGVNLPHGMVITKDGRFTWTPSPSFEGKSVNITVLKKAKSKTIAQSQVTLKVGITEPINKVIFPYRSLIRLDGKDIWLSGTKRQQPIVLKYFDMLFDMKLSNIRKIKKLKVRKVVSSINYHLPSSINRTSHFFVLGDNYEEVRDYSRTSLEPHVGDHIKYILEVDEPLKLFQYEDLSGILDMPDATASKWTSSNFQDISRDSGLFFIGIDESK